MSTAVGALDFGGIFALSMLVAQESMFLYKGGILLLNITSVAAIYSVIGARPVDDHFQLGAPAVDR